MHKSAIAQRIFLIVFILLSGCGGSPDVQVNELSSDTVSYDETIRINNCGGKADSEQTVSRSFATNIEGGAEFKAGYQMIVEGGISAKYSQYRNVSKSQRLIAPPGTRMEFVLRWSDEIHAGNVTVEGKTGTYAARIPIAVEQISSEDIGCSGVVQTQPISPNPPANMSFEPNTNRGGMDYTDFVLPQPEPLLCSVACANDIRCQAWTYRKPDVFFFTSDDAKPHCWLKSGIPIPQSNDWYVSGIKQ